MFAGRRCHERPMGRNGPPQPNSPFRVTICSNQNLGAPVLDRHPEAAHKDCSTAMYPRDAVRKPLTDTALEELTCEVDALKDQTNLTLNLASVPAHEMTKTSIGIIGLKWPAFSGAANG